MLKEIKEVWHKRGYHTYSDVIFGSVAWIWLSISDFFAEYLDFVFTMGGKIEKLHAGPPPGPRGSAAALGPGGGPPCDFSIFPPIVKKSQDISKKVRDIRQIHAISQKNVAICIIAKRFFSLQISIICPYLSTINYDRPDGACRISHT